MTDMSVISWSTNNFKRVATCPLSAEIQQACNIDHGLFAARLLWSDINGYRVTKQKRHRCCEGNTWNPSSRCEGSVRCGAEQQFVSFGSDKKK